jgi:Protein of unknown function (DUF2442)
MGENALMNKSTARVVTSDAEIDAAIAQAKLYEEYRPKAVSAKYLRTADSFAIKLATGVEIVIPRKLLQGLDRATPSQLADVRIVAAKSGLRWRALDVDHYLPSLIEGVFGNRRWMSAIGRKGGTVRSAAKSRAVRENGRKGGRPKNISALRSR